MFECCRYEVEAEIVGELEADDLDRDFLFGNSRGTFTDIL